MPTSARTRPSSRPVTAPLYALAEGLFLGAVSALYEARFEGIVLQAVILTFGTLFALLAAYRSGLVRATENFKLGVVAATGGIALVYLATIVLGFFGISIPHIHESGQGKANPCALLLAAVQMLEHIGQQDNAERLRKAIIATMEAKDSLTGDLGGTGSTMDFAKAIASRL